MRLGILANIAQVSFTAQTVAVTGAAGFIGSHLVDHLLTVRNVEVVAFDNLSTGRLENLAQQQRNPRLRFVEGDTRDASAVRAALKEATTVYHFATRSSVQAALDDAEGTILTNVLGTFNVLRAAAESGARRFIFASSCEVYGQPRVLPVEETHPLSPVNSYGASNVAAEAYCRSFRRHLQMVILRLTNVYGQRDSGQVIPVWFERAAAGEPLQVRGGDQVGDFVWVGVVVQALVRAGGLEGESPPINVGSGTGTRMIDVAKRIGDFMGREPTLTLQPIQPGEVTRFVPSIDRMRHILGIEPPSDPLARLADLAPVPAR